MIEMRNIEGVYFIGIGGIGMSALASYFLHEGFIVSGYDRTESNITRRLSEKGCIVTFKDSPDNIPELFGKISNKEKVIIVFTPAIPSENSILSFFTHNNYRIYKRSEVLGEISSHTTTLAIAGTHGKTTVSAMTAHLLKQSHVDCSAFLGGISKNYDSNLLLGNSQYTVIEADEFDRSFLRLNPAMAVITSADPDHLDIYGDYQTMIGAFNEFCTKIKPGGILILNYRIKDIVKIPEGIRSSTYGSDERSDYRYFGIERKDDYYSFGISTPSGTLNDIHFPFPGIINIENITAAIAIAINCGVTEEEIRQAVLLFRGVRRRFDVRINLPGLTYIDDYAHHPEEIRAFIKSVREYFAGRKITGIFQPHLFSRTRDHAEGFAAILDELDDAIILPVYPAREKPVAGVTSELIFKKMKSPNKRMMTMDDIIGKLKPSDIDVLVTIGAGDIDRLAGPIEEKLKAERS
jgi:UDP-N-acetylmuramate--alanine ligase